MVCLHDSSGWTYFYYDANGNTVTEQTPEYTRYFDWDGRDMLVRISSTEPDWTDNEIRYDGMASRVSLVDSTGITYFTWDGIRVLKLEDGDGSVKHRQVHGYAPIPSVGDIAQMESADGDNYVPDADQVGTIWKVLDTSAAVANSYAYDAFGVARSITEAFPSPFRFAGKHLDQDPALYHFIARQYGPPSGRFLSRDTVGSQRCYVPFRNLPLSKIDPYGLQAVVPRVSIKGCCPEDVHRLEQAVGKSLRVMRSAYEGTALPTLDNIDMLKDCFNAPPLRAGHEIFLKRVRRGVLKKVRDALEHKEIDFVCEEKCSEGVL